MTRRPTSEILDWMGRTGRPQADALDEFFPDATEEERRREADRLRQAVKRARDSGDARFGGGPAAPPPPRAAPNRAPDLEPGEDEDRLSFLRRQLADLIKRRDRAPDRLYGGLDKRVSEVRKELDLEVERERRVVRLARTPAAICAELAKRAPAVALRAEMQRRKEAAATEEEG